MIEEMNSNNWNTPEKDERNCPENTEFENEKPGERFEKYCKEYENFVEKHKAGKKINLERAEFIETIMIKKGLSEAIYNRKFCKEYPQ